MAKKRGALVVKLLSTEGTGTFYVAKKNPKTKTSKMEVRKYDRRLRRHVSFKEAKIK
ncbi:50S ribosomal protein L33 [Candidatus Hepatobacter penaei]|uniref:50S ribosomal protein L33 n=1 Tax=Candidatus Hepatobacter penaei TaxID=1274402 RepID=UPI0004F3DDBB|nr:50S ribosomal protein L33 [Candidatus Hepatobacter penaei]